MAGFFSLTLDGIRARVSHHLDRANSQLELEEDSKNLAVVRCIAPRRDPLRHCVLDKRYYGDRSIHRKLELGRECVVEMKEDRA